MSYLLQTPFPKFSPPSGNYFYPYSAWTSTTTTLTLFRACLGYIPVQTTIFALGAEVTVAADGGVVRLGMYYDQAGLPGKLLVDAGTISATSVTGQNAVLSSPLTVAPGWYWFGGVGQGYTSTGPTLRGAASPPPATIQYFTGPMTTGRATCAGVGMAMSNTSGALPTTFTVGNTIGAGPRLWIKVN